MNDDNVSRRRHSLERVADRVLPPAAALDDNDRLRARAQVLRWRGRQIGRQRDRDIGDRLTVEERFDAALKDAAAGEPGELLRLTRAKAQPAPARGDDG